MAITYNNVKNPRWANADKTFIHVDVDFDHLDEEYVSFTAAPNDCEPHGKEIFEKAAKGEFGKVTDYVAPPPRKSMSNPLVDRITALEAALKAAKIM